CALGFYSWRLYVANRLWRDAAQLTRSIKDDLTASSSQKHLTILNAPDNLRGVPVFHNGLPEALQFFQTEKPIESVEINAFQTLQLASDENSLHPADDMFTLQPANRVDTFSRASSSDCLELLSQSADGLKLRRKPCLTTTEVYFLSGGKMRPAFRADSHQ
ncbi:MAG TPA: hypothetical protein VHQ95_05675, partial [Pyrinomonadaceae bacterium]|nr:hypothetical protein [Pyrinomonadaceae bacterium]